MSLPSTVGNWTYDAEIAPSSTSTKSLTLPTVAWSADYFTADKSPIKRKLNADSVKYYLDTTGPGHQSSAIFAIGRSAVANVYNDIDYPLAARLPNVTGVKALSQYIEFYRGTNSVSGNEMEFPVIGSYFVTVPAWSGLPEDILEDFVIKHFARLTGTSSKISGILSQIIRGDLDLTT